MPLKRIFFFATPSDIIPVLRRLDSEAPLKYVETGNLTRPDRAIHLDSSTLPEPGIATHESGIASRSYLVLPRDAEVRIRKFVGRAGEDRWSLHHNENPDSVVLTPAGLWGDVLLEGKVDTLHEAPAAQQLMKWFLAALKREGFTRVRDGAWLGREARGLLDAGKRLTQAAQSPPEYDLQRPS